MSFRYLDIKSPKPYPNEGSKRIYVNHMILKKSDHQLYHISKGNKGTLEFLINVMFLINLMLLDKDSYLHVFFIFTVIYSPISM